jgi:hypothetical protein
MLLISPRMVALAACCITPVAVAPMATAAPSANIDGPADAVIDELQTQGYNVEINWVNGFDTKPLSLCRVTGIDDPGDAPPATAMFTTVYVDVVCPNHDGG